jgi:hypothetical protein
MLHCGRCVPTVTLRYFFLTQLTGLLATLALLSCIKIKWDSGKILTVLYLSMTRWLIQL